MIIIDYIALVVAAFGGAIITWGILLTGGRAVILEARSLRRGSTCKRRDSIRQQLGSYLLLGLEFMIAADVIATIRDPSLEEIAILASIVLIRTVLSYFLNREHTDPDA